MSDFDQKDQKVNTQINTAIQQFVSLTLPAPYLLGEKTLEDIQARIKKLHDLKNTDEIINSLSAILQQALNKEQTIAYVNSIATVYELIKPVTLKYLQQSNKVLPYASIIENLLLHMAAYFAQTDCFSMYGKDISYSDSSSEILLYPSIQPLRYTNMRTIDSYFPPSPPKQRVLPLKNLSEFLRTDPLFKDILGYEGLVLIERKTIENKKPIESFRNKILKALHLDQDFEFLMKQVKETTHPGVLYFQIPSHVGRIYFDNQYFIRFEREPQVKIPAQTFSNFYYGFVLDLLNYIHEVQIEANSAYKTLSSIDKAFSNSQNRTRG
jgi:hypothetical protein